VTIRAETERNPVRGAFGSNGHKAFTKERKEVGRELRPRYGSSRKVRNRCGRVKGRFRALNSGPMRLQGRAGWRVVATSHIPSGTKTRAGESEGNHDHIESDCQVSAEHVGRGTYCFLKVTWNRLFFRVDLRIIFVPCNCARVTATYGATRRLCYRLSRLTSLAFLSSLSATNRECRR
jgi:hypothetical protein